MQGGKYRITSCFNLIIWVFREMQLCTLADGKILTLLPITAWACFFNICFEYYSGLTPASCTSFKATSVTGLFITRRKHLLLHLQKCKLLLHFIISSFQERKLCYSSESSVSGLQSETPVVIKKGLKEARVTEETPRQLRRIDMQV